MLTSTPNERQQRTACAYKEGESIPSFEGTSRIEPREVPQLKLQGLPPTLQAVFVRHMDGHTDDT